MYMVYSNPHRQAWLLYEAQIYGLSHPYQQHMIDLYSYSHPISPRFQIEPIQIWSPKELSKAYEYLGINKKLGLTGRPKRPFGVLSTSKVGGRIFNIITQ